MLTFAKRDFTFVQVSDVPRDDGVWVSGTVSVITEKLPRVKDYTRAFQDSIAFYEEVPPAGEGESPRTKITIVCRIDLNDSSEDGDGGNIPMWIYVKTVGSAGVLTIKNMRNELLKEQNEKNKQFTEKEKVNETGERIGLTLTSWFSKIGKSGNNKMSITKDNVNETKECMEPSNKDEEESFFSPIFNMGKWTKYS